jgi:lipoprotein-anchoring transpeptidase ErfK/SrfK
VGRHRQLERCSTPPRSTIPRHLAVGAALVAGFLSVQVFMPAHEGALADQPGRIAAATVAQARPDVATTTLRSFATQSDKTKSADDSTALPSHSGTGRRVVYSVSLQRVWVVGNAGRVQRTYLVSGRLSQPLAGRYHVYSKARWTVSTVSSETMQYMVRFTHGTRTGTPIGFHSIPRSYSGHAAQSVQDLGKPLSAGCVRQRMRDAEFLWGFAHVGTSVVVTP